MTEDDQPVLRALLASVCAWELVALSTPLPTITSMMRRVPTFERVVIFGLVTAAFADHFFTRRFVR